jgi:hypothetical protein
VAAGLGPKLYMQAQPGSMKPTIVAAHSNPATAFPAAICMTAASSTTGPGPYQPRDRRQPDNLSERGKSCPATP